VENDPDNPTPPRLGLYNGVVTSNADPLKIGRVRVRVPGLIVESDWAFPLALSRGENVGFWQIPKVGADVGVWFLAGDHDRVFYVPGHCIAPRGQSKAPTTIQAADVTPDAAAQISVWETEDHVIVLDGRPGAQGFEVRDKITGDGVSYERASMSLSIKSTVAVKIESSGVVDINALAVTIMGRPVVPGAGPIR
jgi:phage baseplate assembly protein gpV